MLCAFVKVEHSFYSCTSQTITGINQRVHCQSPRNSTIHITVSHLFRAHFTMHPLVLVWAVLVHTHLVLSNDANPAEPLVVGRVWHTITLTGGMRRRFKELLILEVATSNA